MHSAHVRRYMMDGNVFPREWSAERIRQSQALFERRGVGTWRAYDKNTNELAGFCGFENSPGRPDPQLMYSMFGPFTGRGVATEMARASIVQARTQPGFAEIVADVDEINAAAVRVLEARVRTNRSPPGSPRQPDPASPRGQPLNHAGPSLGGCLCARSNGTLGASGACM
jgi:hypothetical protein